MKAFRTLLMAAALCGGGALASSYTVKAGDTLYKVALAHNLEPAALMQLNKLSSSTLEVGQTLNVGTQAAPTPAARPTTPAAKPPSAVKARTAPAPAAKAAPVAKTPAKAPAKAAPVNRPAAPAPAARSGGAFVRTAATRFLGIRYVLGGTGSGGLDCSGFTMRVFQAMGIRLPRTSNAQWRSGQAVSRRNLQAGDLVFFNTTGRGVSHVGVYVGNGQMANANTFQGRTVIEPLFSNPYWASRYLGARRILS